MASFVDDQLCLVRHQGTEKEVLRLMSRVQQISSEGECEKFLGMRVRQLEDHTLLDLHHYLQQAKQNFPLDVPYEDYKPRPYDTPASADLLDLSVASTGEPDKRILLLFQQVMGTINYACFRGRIDARLAASVLSQHLVHPTPKVLSRAFRVLAYLARTSELALKFKRVPMKIIAGTDASHANITSTRRSVGAHVVCIGELDNFNLLHARCNIQRTVSLSSTDSEFIQLVQLARDVVCCRTMMAELGHPIFGDRFYATPDGAAASDRLLLHAKVRSFDHPISGERLTFSAPCPF